MFESDFLEYFSHVHPITPLIVWAPFITWLYWRSFEEHGLGASTVISLSVAGFFIWTLAEYLLHRFVFHFEGSSKLSRRIHFMIHGVHHDAPDDATRLVMPPVAGIVIASVLYVIFRLFLGAVWVEPFFAAFLIGYLVYDYTHYYVHHFTPKTRWGKMVKQKHMLHHFVTPNALWGVSSPLWDYVFGTLEEKADEPRPQSAS